MMRLNRKAFTLVEIMIVVAIIALLAAIAIPNLLRARLNANEAASIGNLKTMSTALESYRAAQTPPSYPTVALGIAILGTLTPPYIDSVLSSGTKQGYTFTFTPGTDNGAVGAPRIDTYGVVAAPSVVGSTGNRSFFVDHSGVIRVGTSAAGTPIE